MLLFELCDLLAKLLDLHLVLVVSLVNIFGRLNLSLGLLSGGAILHSLEHHLNRVVLAFHFLSSAHLILNKGSVLLATVGAIIACVRLLLTLAVLSHIVLVSVGIAVPSRGANSLRLVTPVLLDPHR